MENKEIIEDIENNPYSVNDSWIEETVVLKNSILENYNNKMKKIENNIWDLIEKYDYYKKIRGIMDGFKNGRKMSKRQAIRLYEFMFDIKPAIIHRQDMSKIYDEIKNELFEKEIKLPRIYN